MSVYYRMQNLSKAFMVSKLCSLRDVKSCKIYVKTCANGIGNVTYIFHNLFYCCDRMLTLYAVGQDSVPRPVILKSL